MEKSPRFIFSFYPFRFFCPFLYLTPPPIKAYIRYISLRHTCLKSRIHNFTNFVYVDCTGTRFNQRCLDQSEIVLTAVRAQDYGVGLRV